MGTVPVGFLLEEVGAVRSDLEVDAGTCSGCSFKRHGFLFESGGGPVIRWVGYGGLEFPRDSDRAADGDCCAGPGKVSALNDLGPQCGAEDGGLF